MLRQMVAALFHDLTNVEFLRHNPWLAVVVLFQLWMCVDAIRREEWIWAACILFFFAFSAILYYFMVYRAAPSATRGFELPGSHHRKRIKELQAKIHHLDKAHHYFQLGDIYFQQGKLERAEACYRASLEREPEDIDARAHFGQCLLRQKKPAEARPWLEGVCRENPKHDYGYSLMALAETLNALGETSGAMEILRQVTANHAYPRAKVQLAELYLAQNQIELARTELKDVIADDIHAPNFQRKRDKFWVRRAKGLARKLPA